MLPRLKTFNEKGTGLPFSSQPCSTLALLVMWRCARACLITFELGILANVLAALRAAADRPMRVSRLSSSSISVRTSQPLRTSADRAVEDVSIASAMFLLRFDQPFL